MILRKNWGQSGRKRWKQNMDLPPERKWGNQKTLWAKPRTWNRISTKSHKDTKGAGRTEKAGGTAGELDTRTTKAPGTDRYWSRTASYEWPYYLSCKAKTKGADTAVLNCINRLGICNLRLRRQMRYLSFWISQSLERSSLIVTGESGKRFYLKKCSINGNMKMWIVREYIAILRAVGKDCWTKSLSIFGKRRERSNFHSRKIFSAVRSKSIWCICQH